MVPPVSHRVSRVRRYSGCSLLNILFAYGVLTLYDRPSQTFRLKMFSRDDCPQPRRINPSVWPLPRSLATTYGISFDFSSRSYLDVSVQIVPHVHLFDSMHVTWILSMWVAPFGNSRIDGYLLLPETYRSLSRPSSAPDAKAFPLRSL